MKLVLIHDLELCLTILLKLPETSRDEILTSIQSYCIYILIRFPDETQKETNHAFKMLISIQVGWEFTSLLSLSEEDPLRTFQEVMWRTFLYP